MPGPRSDWIEAGQAIVANVSVAWDGAAMRARLMVHEMTLDGDAPDPVQLLWDDGAQQWSYSRDMQVALSGILTPDDSGGYRLHEAGGDRSIALEPLASSIASTNSTPTPRSASSDVGPKFPRKTASQ